MGPSIYVFQLGKQTYYPLKKTWELVMYLSNNLILAWGDGWTMHTHTDTLRQIHTWEHVPVNLKHFEINMNLFV